MMLGTTNIKFHCLSQLSEVTFTSIPEECINTSVIRLYYSHFITITPFKYTDFMSQILPFILYYLYVFQFTYNHPLGDIFTVYYDF